MDYTDKIILVTGGSSGIGKEIVRQFYEHHAKVIFCSNDTVNGNKVISEFSSKLNNTDDLEFIYCDVRNETDILNVMDRVKKKYDRLDVLVNVVGYHPEDRTIDQSSKSDFDSLIQVNLMSYFLFCKYSLPLLRRSTGCIVNISSNVGNLGQRRGATYAATKGAITSLTKSLAIDEAEFGVRVNAVSPGMIMTPLLVANTVDNVKLNAAAAVTTYENEIQKMENMTVLKRLGETKNVADACLFLSSSDLASYITGVDLFVTGGTELGYGLK